MGDFVNSVNPEINLITLFTSTSTPSKLFADYFTPGLFTLYIPSFTESEITEILVQHHSDDSMPDYYAVYLTHMVKTLFTVCTNISELTYIIRSSWDRFKSMLTESNHKYDVWELTSLLKPIIKDSIGRLYTRSSEQQLTLDETNLRCLQLPRYSRYLLIAGYIASHVNKAADKVFFMKNTGKLSSSKKISIKKQDKIDTSLMSPRPFTIDRLFAIYSCIVDGDSMEDSYWSVTKLVDNLVHARLFVAVNSKTDLLKCGKLICVTSYDFIVDVSRSVRFDIGKYLTVGGQ